MSRKKNRGFPFEYYIGENLTEQEARINRKMFFMILGSGGPTYRSVSNTSITANY